MQWEGGGWNVEDLSRIGRGERVESAAGRYGALVSRKVMDWIEEEDVGELSSGRGDELIVARGVYREAVEPEAGGRIRGIVGRVDEGCRLLRCVET